ncbi:hypothetical protein Cph01nite_37150 [Cellulomonas phragmiteti]|uniref:Uncharacterized protein n=1 Tax=Cellulomonas phragmiteti TaxID=478780 RepID=A0ABQ4DRH1_9CELL|nr:hypothetical protein Cph01nite_37150 [Cellulomonas phragmiteti]
MTPLLGLVPVPYVPPEPPLRTAGSTLGWSLGILGLTALLGFAVFTVRGILNMDTRVVSRSGRQACRVGSRSASATATP